MAEDDPESSVWQLVPSTRSTIQALEAERDAYREALVDIRDYQGFLWLIAPYTAVRTMRRIAREALQEWDTRRRARS
jgi:hypothetical protein